MEEVASQRGQVSHRWYDVSYRREMVDRFAATTEVWLWAQAFAVEKGKGHEWVKKNATVAVWDELDIGGYRVMLKRGEWLLESKGWQTNNALYYSLAEIWRVESKG